MCTQQINRGSRVVLILLSPTALVTVVTGLVLRFVSPAANDSRHLKAGQAVGRSAPGSMWPGTSGR